MQILGQVASRICRVIAALILSTRSWLCLAKTSYACKMNDLAKS
jgi:hypothetical protein